MREIEMREVLPRKLWLGNSRDAKDVPRLMEIGIVAVVDLAYEETSPPLPRDMVYCRFPMYDGQQASRSILATAIETLLVLLRNGVPTLVCCLAGMSRSPALVAGVLSLLDGGSPDAYLRKIVEGHPHDISPRLWEEVKEACKMAAR
jgi:protein-tyrosine phosphatase